jgi:F-type H+-transporting ATPase subunit delta
MDTTLAKRYAKALLELGEDKEDGQYLKYGEELKDFSRAILEAGPEVKVLDSPAYPLDMRKKILNSILEKAAYSPNVDNFIRLVFDRGRFPMIGEITQSYLGLVDEKNGIIRGTVTTVSPLEDRNLSSIREALSTYVGKKVELTQKIDPSLIGGVVARLGDLVLDGSVKTRLDKLSSIFNEE